MTNVHGYENMKSTAYRKMIALPVLFDLRNQKHDGRSSKKDVRRHFDEQEK